ncbi:MAG: hypothetical protein LBH07_02305 [Treponema sp.]|nr:hypothetical protein [Treponema sp.]
MNKLCGACTIKDDMIQTRLDATHKSGIYMGNDGQQRLKECKVSSQAFDASRSK